MTSYEYALIAVSDTHAARVPLPADQTPEEREAYVANVPAAVLEQAERWPLSPALAPAPADAAPADLDAPVLGDEE